jgi:hypothetical protein
MLKIIKERTPVTVTEYFIEFKYKDDPNAGFCFPANKDGTPAFDKMCSEAVSNYKSCLTDDRLTEAEFTTNTFTYVDSAIGECTCGALVTLDGDYQGAVMCECGRWYNLFGQSLRDPKYWED